MEKQIYLIMEKQNEEVSVVGAYFQKEKMLEQLENFIKTYSEHTYWFKIIKLGHDYC